MWSTCRTFWWKCLIALPTSFPDPSFYLQFPFLPEPLCSYPMLASPCSDLLDWPRLWKLLMRLCLRTFSWSTSVSLGLTFCVAFLHREPGFPSSFWPQRKLLHSSTGLEIFPHYKEHLEIALCTDLIPASPSFQSDSGTGGSRGVGKDDTESECRRPWDLLVQPSHFSDKETEAQGGETTNSRSQKKLMSDLRLDLRILNSQLSVFAWEEFTVDHGWKISCLKW